MEMEVERNLAEQEKARMYIQYLSNIFSRPQEGKPDPKFLKAKEEFEGLLMPSKDKERKTVKNEYEWDFDPALYIEHDS